MRLSRPGDLKIKDERLVCRQDRLMGIRIDQAHGKPRKDWRNLNDDELDAQVRHLALSGDTNAAVRLLQRGRGMSLTEAKTQVDNILAATPQDAARDNT